MIEYILGFIVVGVACLCDASEYRYDDKKQYIYHYGMMLFFTIFWPATLGAWLYVILDGAQRP